MVIRTIEEALGVIGEASVDQRTKDEAHLFIKQLEPDTEISQLVEALRSNNFKVQWEAAKILSERGIPALKGILQALVDPRKAGDIRLRENVYHVLHNHKDSAVRQMTAHLLEDLRGSAADLKTLNEAHRLLQRITQQEKSSGSSTDYGLQ